MAMDCICIKERFRLKLSEIASNLSADKLEKLKFLCEIPSGEAEKISNAEQLFLVLEHGQTITPHRLDFLGKCLEQIGRKDLAAELETFECECSCEAGKSKLNLMQIER